MENYIIIKNVESNDIENILMDISNSYSDFEFSKGIRLYRENQSTNSFLILFTNSPDFTHFCFFVNYLKYPEAPKVYNPFIRGYFKTSEIDLKDLSFINGEWVMAYVSINDKEYDNVNLTNSNNESYLYDFGGKIKRLNIIEEKFNHIEYDLNNYNHIIDIYPYNSLKEKSIKPWWKFW